ncbi:hypothetical protein NM688_g3799 [Phlebia brevispora]|uniref:Uncharacterized protein n=1 Tax=Phlebia brevispora TaxID=194682 RepID=A0ACC1T4Q0_9APHY|nr:hypothetical protein NM688_g3799 [Phlebia brevispora]
MTFSAALAFATLLFAANVDAVHVIFGNTQPVVRTRLDPIVDPGVVSEHVHDVFGGSGFSPTYDYNTAVNSQCTTTIIPQDKSNYWVPSGYYVDPNGTFSLMPVSMNIYYLVRPGSDNDTIVPFPAGLRMLAGDNERGTYNASSEADQAISYMCLDYNNDHTGDPDWAERPNFFDHQCPDGMRAQAFFPSCWDGQNLDSPDHKSHMAYPIGAYNTGLCPDTHPVHLLSLFYEYIMPTGNYPYNGAGTWSFSNGDQVGYRFHADFTNGWTDLNLLQQLIDNCPNAQGNTADCPALAAVQDANAAAACEFSSQIVDEDIGLDGPISVLPGCNLPWDGNGTMPACGNLPTPGFVNAIEPLPSGWNAIGCIAEGTSGRALTGASISGSNMTKAVCSATCADLGFTYAGAEYGDECYCGNSFENGASQNTIPSEKCNTRCAANTFETCGGPNALALMYNPNPSPITLSSLIAIPSPTSPSSPTSAPPAQSHVWFLDIRGL